jgi:RNA polymerase sigma factor (sigma-70 family)
VRKRVRRSPDDDLRRVYSDHVDAVYAFFAYSVPRADAEDLTASTFERVVKAWRSYDSRKAGERTWILTIARNLLTDHYRRRSHRDAVSTDEHPVLLEGLAEAGGTEAVLSNDQLRAWLAPLGERAREVVALRYAADLSTTDIASLLDLTPANVHQILSRSLRRLREELEGSRDAEIASGPVTDDA